MSNFDFGFISNYVKFTNKLKEVKKVKDKRYVVKFSRSTRIKVDDEKESKEYRESDIPVFEGNFEQCCSFIKLQALDWMMYIMDIEDVYDREISLTENWQDLPRVRLAMFDCQDEKSWSSYTYYEVYDENY